VKLAGRIDELEALLTAADPAEAPAP